MHVGRETSERDDVIIKAPKSQFASCSLNTANLVCFVKHIDITGSAIGAVFVTLGR